MKALTYIEQVKFALIDKDIQIKDLSVKAGIRYVPHLRVVLTRLWK